MRFALMLWFLLGLVGCPQQQAAVVPAATATNAPPPTPTLAAPGDGSLVIKPGDRFVVEVLQEGVVVLTYKVTWETKYSPTGVYGANTRTETCTGRWEVFSIDMTGGSYLCGDGILVVVREGDGFRVTPNQALGVSVRTN